MEVEYDDSTALPTQKFDSWQLSPPIDCIAEQLSEVIGLGFIGLEPMSVDQLSWYPILKNTRCYCRQIDGVREFCTKTTGIVALLTFRM